ncbi:hypothetical protein KM043_002059 [Ampulex compressa]|nr:hypothetical protein KM043_002059 [Ampulex compressa]
MLIPQTIYTAALLTIVIMSGKSFGYPSIRQRQDIRPLCEGCGDACDKCEFGVTISELCGVPECRRGPGQICGGPSETWGVCGDGLICSCNRCSGCSLESLTCFPNPCLPHKTLESRHIDKSERFPITK